MDNEFILQDRLQKIRQIITEYGEENFYVSFSGGKDSTVLSALIDMALPGNTIPRVFANTGIELNMIVDFVERESTSAFVGTRRNQAENADKAYVGKRRLSVQKQRALGRFSTLSA